MLRKYAVVALLVLAPLVAAAAFVSAGARQTPEDLPTIAQPMTWVPFSAEYQRTNEMGRTAFGRHYRGRDGSTRTESGRSLDAINVITIKNVPQAQFYQWTQQLTHWAVHPMQLPPSGWTPRPKLARGLSLAAEMIEGFEVYREEDSSSFSLRAPQLNFFALITQSKRCEPTTQCGLRYFNIKVGEQPAQLFELPSGQPAVTSTEPRGIYRPEAGEKK